MLQIRHQFYLLATVALLGSTNLAPAAETGGAAMGATGSAAVTTRPTSNAATPGSPTLNAADPSAIPAADPNVSNRHRTAACTGRAVRGLAGWEASVSAAPAFGAGR
jgi:hypothetical protein